MADDYEFGADLITAERIHQINAEGYTANHDDSHHQTELLAAAANYLSMGQFIARTGRTDGKAFFHGLPPEAPTWPWDLEYWKPDYDDAIPNLVKAGALIAAEIDRLQRKAQG